MQISKINFISGNKQSVQKNEASQNLSTNPFGVSFKGSVINADVFENKNPDLMNKISSKGKLFASAIVGNINSFNEALQSRLNSAVSFGKKIKSNIFESLEKMTNVEVSVDFQEFSETIKNKFFPNRQYKIKNLVKLPVSDLETMLKQEISA